MTVKKWGVRLTEITNRIWPADPEPFCSAEETWYRRMTVNTSAARVFRWLCQLRVAPYSYDWLDNFGRPSPGHLIAGLEKLRTGQRVMTIFRLADFLPNQFLVLEFLPSGRSPFGPLRITYLCRAEGAERTRLLRVRVNYASNSLRPLMRTFLPTGDLIMMRKQLLRLKALAETRLPACPV
jgi:hypothetical protein